MNCYNIWYTNVQSFNYSKIWLQRIFGEIFWAEVIMIGDMKKGRGIHAKEKCFYSFSPSCDNKFMFEHFVYLIMP